MSKSAVRRFASSPRIAASGVLAAALTAAATAPACPCPEAAAPSILPSRHSQAVPANTLAWVIRERGCTYPTLADAKGVKVPTTRRTFEPDVVMLDPVTDLDIGKTYSILCGRRVLGKFTVTGPPDNSPPDVPRVALGEHLENESICGPFGTVRLETGRAVADQLLILDVNGEARFDAARLEGKAVDVFSPTDLPHVGTSWACQTDNWSFERRGDAPGTRLMVVDLAGNASPWSEPKVASTSCAVPGGLPGGVLAWAPLAFVGLVVLAHRRRRR